MITKREVRNLMQKNGLALVDARRGDWRGDYGYRVTQSLDTPGNYILIECRCPQAETESFSRPVDSLLRLAGIKAAYSRGVFYIDPWQTAA